MFSLFDSPAEFLLFSNFCAFPKLIPLDTFYKVNSQPVSTQWLRFSELPLIFLNVILLLENHLWNRAALDGNTHGYRKHYRWNFISYPGLLMAKCGQDIRLRTTTAVEKHVLVPTPHPAHNMRDPQNKLLGLQLWMPKQYFFRKNGFSTTSR